MQPSRNILARAFFALAVMLTSQKALADADGTWNSSGGATGWTTTVAWLNGIVAVGTNSTAYFTVNRTANMGSANGDWSIGTMIFGDTNNPTGGLQFTLNSNGNGLINVNRITVTASYTARLQVTSGTSVFKTTGVSGLIKDGAGILLYAGATTYTGPTTINAGTLRYGKADAISTGDIIISGGILDMVTFNDSVGAITLVDGSITGLGGYLSGTAYNFRKGTVTANLGGTAGIAKTTVDTVVLSGINTNTGAATISAGTLALTDSGTLASSAISVAAGATFDVSGLFSPFALTTGQTLSGSGIVTGAVTTVSGATLSPGGAASAGSLSFSNNLTISAATLLLDLANTTTVGGGVNDLIQMAGGTLDLSGGTTTVIVNGLLANGTYTLIQGAGSIVGGPANLVAVGPRANYTFDTTAVPGSVLMTVSTLPAANLVWRGNNGNNWDLASTVNWDNGGSPDVFHFGDATIFDDTSANGSVTLVSTVYPASVTVSNASTAYGFGGSGMISGSASLAKNGSGTLVLSNANSYSGATLINGGTLRLSNGSNRLPTSSPVTLANVASSTLDLNGNAQSIASLAGGGGSGGSVTLGSGTLTVNQSADTTFAGSISGTGSLVKQGAGKLVLSGVGSHSGATTVSAGNLQVNGALSSSPVTVSGGMLSGTGLIGGATLVQAGGTLAPGNSGIGTLSISNSLGLAGTTTMEINKSGVSLTSDRVQGMSSVTYGGNLIVIATGDSLAQGDKFTLFTKATGSYGGGFVSSNLPAVPAGLKWDTAGLTVDGSITVVSTNQLTTPGFSPIAGGYIGSVSVTISSDSGSTIYYTTDGSTPTLSSASGASPLNGINIPVGTSQPLKAFAAKPGFANSAIGTASYTTLSNATWLNTAGGSWPLNANWQAGAVGSGSGVLADFSTLTLPANATVTLDGSRTIGSLKFRDVGNSKTWTVDSGSGGSLTLDGPAPSITVSNTATTFNAPIDGTVGFSKNGAGSLSLAGANTYFGPLTIQAGTVVMNNVRALSDNSTNVVIQPGGTLDLNGFIPFSRTGIAVEGSGVGGAGAVVNNTTNSSENIIVTLNSNATFRAGSNATIKCQWAFNANGHKLTKVGAGLMWVFVNGGDWNFGDIDVLEGELQLDANFFNYTDTNYPASVLTVASNAVFSMTHVGGSTFSKKVVVKPGGLFFGRPGAGSTLTESFEVQGAGLKNVEVNNNPLTLNGPMIGAGDLILGGGSAGKLVLNGTNTYAGITLINGGTLTLGASASIAATPNISVKLGAKFDPSGTTYPTIWTQAVNQVLSGDGTVDGNVLLNGTVSPSGLSVDSPIGTLNFFNNDNVTLAGITIMEINKDSGLVSDALNNIFGSITYGGTLQVVLTGAAPLAVNDTVTLFYAAGGFLNGFSSIILPSGYTWDTSQLTVDGTIKVTGFAVPQPTIGSVQVSSGNLTLSGNGGLASGTYWVLSSTNVAAPLANWLPLATNNFAPNGGFTNSLPVNSTEPQRYYRLQVP